jgi:AraC-like DNA-binding protein
LRRLQRSGALWQQHEDVPRYAEEPSRSVEVGRGWLIVTPLIAARDLIGVMFNDSALTNAPIDESKQARAAVFCGLVANLYVARRGSVEHRPLPRETLRSPLVRRVLRTINQDPMMSGERLARQLGISPGHLARSFKVEMGVSLVEYRNRLRIERFFSSVDRGGSNLLDAALEAGFGSYAQFHRVYRKLLGSTPREYLKVSRHRPTAAPRSAEPVGNGDDSRLQGS